MPERLSDKLTEYLKIVQGKRVQLKDIRDFLKIEVGSKEDQNLRTQMSTTMVTKKIVSPSGSNDGWYKVVRQVKPVQVFTKGRERRPPFNLTFPRDFDTGMEMGFADYVVVREGDVITLGGVKNKGKTLLCIGFCAENIDKHPILMGNEYTRSIEDKETGEITYEPASRFYNRLVAMDWVEWTDGDGTDKFTLLPVMEDYSEHIERDRINIIDWINLDANQLYDIAKVIEGIKANLGRGVAIIALQKSAGSDKARGGQFTKDFTDCELLLDQFGDNDNDILLTVGDVKEKTKPISGRTYAYTIWNGIKILNFREVKKCQSCYGKGYTNKGHCDDCNGKKYTDK